MDSVSQWQTLPSDLMLIEGLEEEFFKGGVSDIKNKVLLVHSNKRAMNSMLKSGSNSVAGAGQGRAICSWSFETTTSSLN